MGLAEETFNRAAQNAWRFMQSQNADVLKLSKLNKENITKYAQGKMTWRELKETGITDYGIVLAELGRQGLHPPITPMEDLSERRKKDMEKFAEWLQHCRRDE